MPKYDTWIDTYPIDPAMGRNIWGAKAKIKQVGTGRNDDVIALSEQWGETREEARARADAEAKAWLEKHGDGDSD